MRPKPDLSAYLVLDVPSCAGDPVEVACAAVAGGIRTVQLRDKAASHQARVALGRRLQEALAPSGAVLIINDDVMAAVEIGAAGAHVGQSDMPAAEARRLLGPDRVLGLSIETVAQVSAIDPAVVDHVGIGPIHATATKNDAAPPLGIEGLAQAVARCPVPAVAIGGLSASDAAAVLGTGALGLAVVSAICGRPDPKAAAAELIQAIRQAKTAAGVAT